MKKTLIALLAANCLVASAGTIKNKKTNETLSLKCEHIRYNDNCTDYSYTYTSEDGEVETARINASAAERKFPLETCSGRLAAFQPEYCTTLFGALNMTIRGGVAGYELTEKVDSVALGIFSIIVGGAGGFIVDLVKSPVAVPVLLIKRKTGKRNGEIYRTLFFSDEEAKVIEVKNKKFEKINEALKLLIE